MPAIIRTQALTKRFGRVTALAGVDLTVDAGEVVVLLGPNGAGKSTLTRILGTIVTPDDGTASVGGHDVVAEAARVRSILGVTLGDERSWYWRLSGRHNLEFFAALYGLNRAGSRERAGDLLRQLDLDQAADRRVDGYSAGMRARLSLARALLPDPPVLLLDEPTRSLDPVASAAFRDVIAELAHVRGKAILLTTHNLHEAAALADRVVVLVGGRIAGCAGARSTPTTLEALLQTAMRR